MTINNNNTCSECNTNLNSADINYGVCTTCQDLLINDRYKDQPLNPEEDDSYELTTTECAYMGITIGDEQHVPMVIEGELPF